MGLVAGVVSAITGVAADVVGAGALATAIGTGVTGAGIGAALGAGTAALTGGNIGKGALSGALTGGIGGGFGGAASGLVSDIAPTMSATTANALGYGLSGMAGGAVGAAATGQNPRQAALMGGLTGALSGYMMTPSDVNAAPNAAPSDSSGAVTMDAAGNLVYSPGASVEGSPTSAGTITTDANGNLVYQGASPADTSALSQDALTQSVGSTAAGAAGSSKGLSNTALVLGGLAAADSMFNKPKIGTYATPGPSSTAATQGPLFNTPLTSGNAGTRRTFTTPANFNPMTYGMNPAGEQSFFTNNSLILPYGTANNAVLSNAAANANLAHGGALSRALRHGGPEANGPVFSSAHGAHLVHGGGDGASDSINAKLSRDEYVLRADEVAAIGHGSAEAGAEKLDAWRDWLARQTGKKNRNSDAKGGDGALGKLSKMVAGGR